MVPRALTIAGSDSGGGAGIQADVKTFAAHGVWALTAITAVTAQNTLGVEEAEVLRPGLVSAQIAAVVADIGVDAAKTGMLGSAAVVAAVADAVRRHRLRPLVVDPVMVSSSGSSLLDADGVAALAAELVPLGALVTPNVAEAATLAGGGVVEGRRAMETVGRAVLALGAGAVLVTGGHLEDPGSPDLLLAPGEDPLWLEGRRHPGRYSHGTGCVLSAAVTARLARGESLSAAVQGAKSFVTRAIAAGVDLGGGTAPVDPSGAG